MKLSPTQRNVVSPPLAVVPERIEERCRFEVPDADAIAVARKLRQRLSPVASHEFSLAHRWLVGWRFDQACQWALVGSNENLEASASIEGRWPNTAFNRTRRQRSFLHRTLTRARRLTQR